MAVFKCLGFKLRRCCGGVPDAKVSGDLEENEGGSIKLGIKRLFTCDDIEKFTMNLSRSRLIAYGGFSTVYLAQFPDSTFAAVKIMDLRSERFQRVYKQELDILLQIQHENMVKFLGNCDNGEEGYTDPHYLRTGIASKKNDIYSFGVIILELISGLEAFSSDNGERLISKAGIILRDAKKVEEMLDPKLNGNYDLEEAKAMVALAGFCLGDSPSIRPSASEILHTITSKISSMSFLFSHDQKI
ncbi:hypothetical protein K7X08_005519 [Anisodus acutangulus]|uniref:non-specific serine/threonine protein kinase n=1 Tax=Anisodus acutangulus TaxID=402998 RepID=A0A9Q1LUS7_9SOLA|nr:hypothetical protein K7X08_005519 [Anisodus acutangulus]